MTERLTDAFVKSLPAPATGNRITYDAEVKGFGVRVTANGARSYILNYRCAGRERRYTIGDCTDWKVSAARQHAKDLKREIDMGVDPLGLRVHARTAPTVTDLWKRYEVEHLPRKSERGQKDERAMWEKHILPALGPHKVAEVRASDTDELHRTLSVKTPVRANRVMEVLRKAFALAIRWEWCSANPCQGFHRNPEQPRTRYLAPEELKRLLTALDEHPEVTSARAIKLMLLTGARRGEVLSATWSQFDLERGNWVKPSAHTKQRREHRVPLSAEAWALLTGMREEVSDADCPFVFPGKDGKALTDVKRTWGSVCKAASLDGVRIHDLRHTYASILASTGHSLPIIGALLGHTQAQTTARYSHLLDDPLRLATERAASVLAQRKQPATA